MNNDATLLLPDEESRDALIAAVWPENVAIIKLAMDHVGEDVGDVASHLAMTMCLFAATSGISGQQLFDGLAHEWGQLVECCGVMTGGQVPALPIVPVPPTVNRDRAGD